MRDIITPLDLGYGGVNVKRHIYYICFVKICQVDYKFSSCSVNKVTESDVGLATQVRANPSSN